jgi:hypothetical protein
MNRLLVSRRIALAALALVVSWGLANPAFAGPTVPHRESANGNLTSVIQPNPPSVPLGTMQWVAKGVGSQLGRYTQVGSHKFTAPNANGVGQLNGVFTTTAADGATISGTYSGTYTILPNNTIRFDVVALWLRGTGRLAGVTGRAPVVAIMNATTGAFHYDDLGTWTYP